jgi:hypothetical protein
MLVLHQGTQDRGLSVLEAEVLREALDTTDEQRVHAGKVRCDQQRRAVMHVDRGAEGTHVIVAEAREPGDRATKRLFNLRPGGGPRPGAAPAYVGSGGVRIDGRLDVDPDVALRCDTDGMRRLLLTVAGAVVTVAIALLTGSLEDQVRIPPAVAWTGLVVAVILGVLVATADRGDGPQRARIQLRWSLPSFSFTAAFWLVVVVMAGICVGGCLGYDRWTKKIVADLDAPVRATDGTATVILERVTLSRSRLDVTFTVENGHDETVVVSTHHVCAIIDARGRDLWRGTCKPQTSAARRLLGGFNGAYVAAGQTARLVTGANVDDGADATHVYMELQAGVSNILLPLAELKRA